MSSEGYILRPGHRPLPKKMHPQLPALLARWQNNTSPDDLGIIRFGFDLFPEIVDPKFGVARWVRPALAAILEYQPGMTKLDRAHAICTSRDTSKTTWVTTMLSLYAVLVGPYGIYWKDNLLPEMDYIRIRGQNFDRSEEKLNNIVNPLISNEKVLKLFGNLQPTLKEIKDKKLKNQNKLLILNTGYVFQAIGLNQPSRGALIKNRRPKLDIDDDVETKTNTITPQQRKANSDEVWAEQFGGLGSDGITIYIGNFVHDDCLMKHLLKNNSWKRQFYQLSYIDDTGEEVSIWPERFPMPYIRKLRRFYEKNEKRGGIKLFMREYYNVIVSESESQIIVFDGYYKRHEGHNHVVIVKGDKEEYMPCNIVVSLDPAISQKETGSAVVVSVTAFCADKQRRVLEVSQGKFDIRDRYSDTNQETRIKTSVGLATSPDDLKYVKRRGAVEETIRMALKYNAEDIVVENAGQQLAWYNEIRDLLSRLRRPINVIPYHPKDEKEYKLKTGLLNYVQNGQYEFLSSGKGTKMAIEQLRTFPDNMMDILDALHNAEKFGKCPKTQETVKMELRNEDYSRKKKTPVEFWVIYG